MGQTKIPYCDRTWDLTIGCRKRSAGCEHCWAIRTVHRLRGKGLVDYMGQTATSGDDWRVTEKVNLLENNLFLPARWDKPRFIFVNSKSELFDERVPFEFIAQAFDRMWSSRQHRYMVLTKEPGRMQEFITWYQKTPGKVTGNLIQWPADFPHVILMVSVEDAGQIGRIETLLRIPAALHGVSFEPLLAPVSQAIGRYLWRDRNEDDDSEVYGNLLDWVVVGCEKLAGGRPGRWAEPRIMAWWEEARTIARLAEEAGVPLWMKQGPALVTRAQPRHRVVTEREDFPVSCRVQQHPQWSS